MLTYLYGNECGDPIKEMMFLVEYVPDSENFQSDMAKLMGKIKLAQMQSPSVRIFSETLKPCDGINHETKKNFTYDVLNRVLPASIHSGKGSISSFTDKRKDQGKELRKKIYSTLLKEDFPEIQDYSFTNNLQELSEYDEPGNLNGKIAFIHIDGNKFGNLQKNFSKDEMAKYDEYIQSFKNKFLTNTIKLSKQFESFFNNKKLRLETLLWGGDEIKLIVPACMGWKVASLFFKSAEQNALKIDNKELTYAMALIFTYHKNPIKNLNNLLDDLVNAVKSKIKDPYKRLYGNRMHYLVLESLETLPDDYSYFTETFYKTEQHYLTLTLSEMNSLKDFRKMLESSLGRSQVYAIANAWASGKAGMYEKVLQRALDICNLRKKEKEKLKEEIKKNTSTKIIDDIVQQTVDCKGYRWLQVQELWDYLIWEEN